MYLSFAFLHNQPFFIIIFHYIIAQDREILSMERDNEKP